MQCRRVSIIVCLVWALSSASDAHAAVAFSTILGDDPSSKLTQIDVGEELSFQVFHRTVGGSGQIYPTGVSPADMGIMVRMGGVLYAPNFAMHGGTATSSHIGTYTPWTPVSFSSLSGNGSATTPYAYTVVADAGATGLRVTMVVTYVNAENFFRHNLTFTNNGGGTSTFDVFVGSDIYLADSDSGIPVHLGSSRSSGGKDCDTGDYQILHIPVTPADLWTAKNFAAVWSTIGAGDLDNVLATGCIDNGAALEWKGRSLGVGQSLTILSATSFGEIPAVADKVLAFYVNKDIKNTTGVTAGGVEIEVQGHHTYSDIYHGTTPTFAVDSTGVNDKLRWTGGTILADALVHVGFRTDGSIISLLGVKMLDGSGAAIGCALQLNTGIHTNSRLTWKNTVENCTSTSMYVGNVSLEYYVDQVPLEDLLPGVVRTPMHTDFLALPATLIPAGSELDVHLPKSPNGANWVVAHFEIGSTPSLGETEDWVQVAVSVPLPLSPDAALIMTLGLAALGAWAIHRRNRHPGTVRSED